MNRSVNPDVSIVIPFRNQSQYLRQAIESVKDGLRGGVATAEIIVVDDGSTTEESRLASEISQGHQFVSVSYSNACLTRNHGLSMASGRWVKFLDADDFLAHGSLASQVGFASRLQDKRVSVYGDVKWVDETGREIISPPDAIPSLTEAERMILHAPLTSAPLHCTNEVRQVGGFDARVPRGQEYDLHMRMWLAGVEFVYFPGLIYWYRQHSGPRISSTDGQEAVAKGRLESLLRHVELARETFGTPLPNEMLTAFATNLWRNGRRALQTGANGVEDEYFAAAKQLTGNRAIFGSRAYRMLCYCFGPHLAEQISMLNQVAHRLRFRAAK